MPSGGAPREGEGEREVRLIHPMGLIPPKKAKELQNHADISLGACVFLLESTVSYISWKKKKFLIVIVVVAIQFSSTWWGLLFRHINPFYLIKSLFVSQELPQFPFMGSLFGHLRVVLSLSESICLRNSI